MHRVRAYRPTFDFLLFFIFAYTTLNKLFAVFIYIIFAVLLKKFVCVVCLAESDYESLCQIWCEPVRYWRSYCPLTDYEMVATAMVDFGRSQIWCKSIQKWLSYGHLTDFKMASAAILEFCTI